MISYITLEKNNQNEEKETAEEEKEEDKLEEQLPTVKEKDTRPNNKEQ